MRSHSYWPQNYSRVVFGCHVGGSDVISFSRTISPAKTTKTTNPRDGFGGKWQTSSRKKNTTCLRALRCSSFWCALLYKTICRKVWISTRTQSWFWMLLLCFEWCRVSSFGFHTLSSRSLIGGGKEELEKHHPLETKRTEEQRQKRYTF